MALQLNNGATGNQRASKAAPVDPTNLAVAFAAWVWVDALSTANQYIAHIKENGANAYGLIFRQTAGQFDILRRYAGTDYTASCAGAIADAGAWVFICAQDHGNHNLANMCRLHVRNVADSTAQLKTLVQPGTTASAATSLTGQTWDIGNRPDLARPFKGRIRDVGWWTAPAGTFPLSDQEIADLSTGVKLPSDLATTTNGGTLREDPTFVGGLGWSSASGGDFTYDNSPPNVDAPHAPATARITDGFPLAADASLLCYYSAAETGMVVKSTATINNVKALLDAAGKGRALYHATAANRPRWKDGGAVGGKVLAFPYTTASSTLSGVHTASGIPNAAVTFGFIGWAASSEGTREFASWHNIQPGTNDDGAITVKVGGSTLTPLPKQYFQTKDELYIVSINDPGAGLAKTITLHGPDGASTVNTAAYTASTGNLARLGPVAADGSAHHRNGLKRAFMLSRGITSEEAATLRTWSRTITGRPAGLPNGTLVFDGSSTPEGVNASTEACRVVTYQLKKLNKARAFAHGEFNTGVASIRLTLSGSGTFAEDELVTQTGSGAAGTVVYQNGNTLYLRNHTGTFTTGGADPADKITSPSNPTGRPVTATNFSNSGLWNTARFNRLIGKAQAYSSEPAVLVIAAASNPLNSGWAAADQVEIEKRFITAIKAALPKAKVFIQTPHPRSGGAGASMQTYIASVKALAIKAGGAGPWDDVIDLTQSPYFDFKTSLGVDDNGAEDLANPVSMAPDNGLGADGIHVNEDVGAAVDAALIDAKIAGVFSPPRGSAMSLARPMTVGVGE